jgi:dihydroorotase
VCGGCLVGRGGIIRQVDAGSAGATTFPGFRKFIVDRCKTRVLALLNISMVGAGRAPPLNGRGASVGSGDLSQMGGGLQSPAHISAAHCVDTIEQNRDVIVGIKVALARSWASHFPGGYEKGEAAGFAAAREASEQAGVPLMTHHTFSSVPLSQCPGQLRAGDIYTHSLHGFESTIISPEDGNVDPAVLAAKKRGVIFDLGHGTGSFSWTVAEKMMLRSPEQGGGGQLFIDTISTDIWSGNIHGPVYDLPTVMSKMLALGVPLVEVVRAVTATPAKVIGWQDRIGTLGEGRCADITLLKLETTAEDFCLEDSQSQMRRVPQLLVPVGCLRAGDQMAVTSAAQVADASDECGGYPNPQSLERQAVDWQGLLVRDPEPPPALARAAQAAVRGQGVAAATGRHYSTRANKTAAVTAAVTAAAAAAARGAGGAGGGGGGGEAVIHVVADADRGIGRPLSEILLLPAALSSFAEKQRALDAAYLCMPCSWQPQWPGGPLVEVVGFGGCCC